jgi:DNA repair photolyase
MGLNVSRGNMYDFITHTWNVIKGECPHGCSYCYMKRWKQRPVRFDGKELKVDLGKGNFIFVGSSCDMFAGAIDEKWIMDTLGHCRKFESRYLFQSKNPGRVWHFLDCLPGRSVICTTIETNRVYRGLMNYAPDPWQRVADMGRITGHTKYVTIEPVMDFDVEGLVGMIRECAPVQVNIGADSGGNHLPEPSREKILELIGELEKFTVVKQKKNLERLLIKCVHKKGV